MNPNRLRHSGHLTTRQVGLLVVLLVPSLFGIACAATGTSSLPTRVPPPPTSTSEPLLLAPTPTGVPRELCTLVQAGEGLLDAIRRVEKTAGTGGLPANTGPASSKLTLKRDGETIYEFSWRPPTQAEMDQIRAATTKTDDEACIER